METIDVTWWMWLVFGLMLLVGEILTPGGFFVFFFGVGALVVGLLGATGMDFPLSVEIVIFLGFSILSLVIFRKPMLRRFRKPASDAAVDSLIGEIAVALEDIAVNSIGKAELRGTAWNARNTGQDPIARKQRCKVERMEGLLLFVRGDS
jgi:inner membrane protein